MPEEISLRQRYSQIFVYVLMSALLFIMAKSLIYGPANFEGNLFMRNFLIEKANLIHVSIGDRVFPEALIGKDGWMEFTGDKNLDDFQKELPLHDEKVLVKRLAAFNQFLQEQGITLLIVVAPNKATIYPDKLPDEITPISEQTRLERLEIVLKENNLPPMLDLSAVLQSARKEREVYYKTNTHWNGYGAYIAYAEIINTLKASHPELEPYKLEDLQLETTAPSVQDIPELLKANFIKEENFFYVPKEDFVHTQTLIDYFGYNRISSIPNSDLPTLLMIHDSFSYKFMNDYMSMNFSKSHFIHGGETTPSYLNQETIQQFNPDIIIIEIVERGVDRLEGYLSSFDTKK